MTPSVMLPQSTHLFEMKGRDARDFLHRLTTVNVGNMNPGDFKPGFLLTAQGKVKAAFRIACEAEDTFLIEVEGGKDSHWKDELLKALDMMTFSEKYELKELSGLKNAWVFALPNAQENHLTKQGELTLLEGSRKTYGSNWTSVWGPVKEVDAFIAESKAKPLALEAFDRLRILSLTPKVDTELLLDANPLEIGLREGIADNKGCYPGQEVIEKIISLGSPAKRLALLSGKGAPKVGDKVFTPEGAEVGTLSSLTHDAGTFSGLALLRKNVLEVGKKLKLGATPDLVTDAAIERIADYE